MIWRHKNGFTMIELIFVIVIIGILSAIAIPKFFGVQNSAQEANVIKQIEAIRASIDGQRAQVMQNNSSFKNNGGGTLTLYYNFQPWNGQTYLSPTTKHAVLMNNVSTFRYQAIGSLIKIQLCISDENISKDGGYSICKEQTVF